MATRLYKVSLYNCYYGADRNGDIKHQHSIQDHCRQTIAGPAFGQRLKDHGYGSFRSDNFYLHGWRLELDIDKLRIGYFRKQISTPLMPQKNGKLGTCGQIFLRKNI
jgi:hypothetical protein